MAAAPKIGIRGIRQPIPSGYVLGRKSAGTGQPELVSINDLGQSLVGGSAAVSGGGGSAILAPIADKNLLANISGSTTQPAPHTLSDILDAILSNVRGSVVYRGASAWAALGPGTSGQFLKTQGASANPLWAPTPPGGLWGPVLGTLPTQTGTGFTTQVNGTGATFSDRTTGISISAPADTSGWRGLSQAAPTPPYTRTGLITLTGRGVDFYQAAIGWSDGAKFHFLVIEYNDAGGQKWALEVAQYSSVTAYVTSDVPEEPLLSIPLWVRLVDDGTNVTFRMSQSGDTNDFIDVFTVAKASGYLGPTGYSNIVFAAQHFGTSPTSPAIGTLMSWG